MAKQSPKHNSKTRGRTGRGRGMGNMPAVIALIALVALPLAYLAQSAAGRAVPAGGLRVSEVMTSNATALVAADGGLPDWIELENASGAPIDLTGCAIVRESDPSDAFTFPGGVLQPGEFALVYADGAASGEGAWHAPFRLPASGERLALLDKRGAGLDLVEIPALARDQVWCRDAAGDWQVSDIATPGAANRVERVDRATRDVNVVPGALEISEVMSDNATFFPDESGACPDYVEIRNVSSGPVNLEGWSLSDARDKLTRWQFPAVTLPAGGYIAVHCSGENRVSDPAHLHANFKISNKGEEIFLTAPNGVTVSRVKTPAMEPDQAYTLLETGWTKQFSPSPGQANTPDGADAAAEGVRARNGRGVFITEVLASSSKSDDWIELYNASAEAVDLSGFGLSDNAGRPRKWQFPSGTVIQPGAYLGVFANGLDASTESRLQTNFCLSADGGYSITLSEPDGAVFDRLFVPMQYEDMSFGRTEDRQGLRYFTTVTPGAANDSPAYLGRAARPVYSVEGGLYHTGDVLDVTLSVPSGCRAYYTLDNTDPDESATPYSGPIHVTDTTILRTRVYGEGYLESFMDTQSYLYDVNNGDGTLFVVSLVSDPYNLTDYNHGIMVKGPNAWSQSPYGAMNQGANFWMDWEREAHVEVFNPDGSTMLSQECGIKLHGQYSRKEAQQAFKVIARSKYGGNRFNAAIFSRRDYTEYQSFLLRASGQDSNMTRMRDSVLQALAEDTSVMYQETELCQVYLDGEYWGHYNIRERINTASVCQFEGWEGDEDDIDLIKANTNVMQGSNETMAQLLDWIKRNNTNTDEALEAIGSVIDIQNYIEYMAIEMYTGNTDTLNVKRYRNAKADGKWRWVLFDLDWAFHEDTNSVRRWINPGGMGNANRTDNSLFIACMKNDTFRDRFLTYLGQKMATDFSTEALLARFEERYYQLKPILADQLARWDKSESSYNSALKSLISYAQKRPYRMLQFLKYCDLMPLSEAQMQQYFGEAMAKAGTSYAEIKNPKS